MSLSLSPWTKWLPEACSFYDNVREVKEVEKHKTSKSLDARLAQYHFCLILVATVAEKQNQRAGN